MSDRSSKDIEREIEAERSDLDETLGELSGRFDTDYVVRQIGTQLRDNGSEIARSIQRSVKENPMALALTGVGLGWLIFGQGRDPVADRRYASTRHTAHTEPTVHTPHTPRAERAAGTTPGPDWVYPDPDEFVTPGDFDHLDDDSDHGGPGVGERTSYAAGRAKEAAGRATSSVSGSAQKARSGAKARAAAARARKDRMQARLSRGTEKMNAEARDRVIRARRRALEARDSASRSARRGFDKASDFYEEQPLVAGAIALAVGAALAGGLPRSRMEEDRYLGEHSDALMDEAERIFREESEKAKSVVSAAGDEAQKVAEEKREAVDQTASGAASAVREEAEDAARRVGDRAKDEAERKDLGKPRT